jgi:phosphatidylinositol alpha-mannosyltransferase
LKVQFNGNRMSTPLPASRRRIRRLLEKERFDILHVQIPYSPFMAAKVLQAAPLGTALFGTFHIAPHSSFVRISNRILGMVLKRSLRRLDRVFAVSEAAADLARRAYGLETDILPNVVKADVFTKAAPLDVPASQYTIMFLGRLVPRKGCRVLLEALALLKDDPAFSSLKIYICGGGPLRDELTDFAVRSGIGSKVEFTGFVDEAAKASYLKTSDIAVFPSSGGESFGIVLLEAMAADHPVVLGAANEGYAAVLGPYQESLFPVNDPAGLAEKIRLLLTDSQRRDQARSWQRTYIRQFDVQIVGRRLIGRYEEVLRKKMSMR